MTNKATARVFGTLRWTDRRDAEAVVVDAAGNEFYANWSTSPLFDFADHSLEGKRVEFEVREGVAWNVLSGLDVYMARQRRSA